MVGFRPSFYFQIYLFVKLGFCEQIDISLISPLNQKNTFDWLIYGQLFDIVKISLKY